MIRDGQTGFKLLDMSAPVKCLVVERVNRFVVEVDCAGRTRRAYLNNTGRLCQFLVSGRKGWCMLQEPGKRTDLRLFAVEEAGLAAVVDTQLQTQAFEKALEAGLVPWLEGCRMVRRNARLGTSLIDYLLERDGREVYLEVKSAVLREGSYAMYPDCPSERGRRHIGELTEHVRGGGEAFILFIAALPDVKAFKPNRSADPKLYELLVEAQQAGVAVKSIAMAYHPDDSSVGLQHPDLAVALST